MVQDITILNIDSKDDKEWRALFDDFGLKTFFITDLDSAWKFYPNEEVKKVNTPPSVHKFLTDHPDVVSKIKADYSNDTFILKKGDLEIYLGIKKGLSNVIDFCKDNLKIYLSNNNTDTKVQEIRMIMSKITGENEADLW